jgi:DNA-binding protein
MPAEIRDGARAVSVVELIRSKFSPFFSFAVEHRQIAVSSRTTMAGKRRKSTPNAATSSEIQLLIEEVFDGLEALAEPPPRWLRRARCRRPSGTAAECQHEETLKKERKALI